MANSAIVGKIKNKIIKELIKDPDIIKAIGSTEVSESTPEKYLNKHIFNYHQNPYTLNIVGTFITIQVHLPSSADKNGTFMTAKIEIHIISHEKNMIVNNVPKITQNRNDYLGQLIDTKFNGRSGFGIGKLNLAINIEGAFRDEYLFRRLVFECTDLNNSLCEEE